MVRPYSEDLRKRILAAYDRGMKTKPIAFMFEVSSSFARRCKQRRRDHGETTPRRSGGVTVRKIDPEELHALVHRWPDATLAELRQRLEADCAASTVGVALQRLGMTVKKSRDTPRSRTGRTSRPDAPNGNSISRGRKPGG